MNEAEAQARAYELAWKAGHEAAFQEIANEMGLTHPHQLDDPRINYVDVQIDKETYRQLVAARFVERTTS